MFIRPAVIAALVVALPQLLIAQLPPDALSTIERLAVRAGVDNALRLRGDGKLARRIVIDPMMVPAGQAPPGRGTKTRDPARQAYLLRSFGARSELPQSVIDCSSRPCKLRDADMLVSLSEPQVAGDEASVTVTALQQVGGRTGTFYVTVNVVLQRERSGWKVVRLDELGIS